MRILVPGRWQPFNAGHEQYIESLRQHGKIVIGIRDCGPFTQPERREMIEAIFPELETIYLPCGKYSLWQCIGNTDIIATANLELGLKLIKQGITTLLVPEIRPDGISSTQIRERLASRQSIAGLVNPIIEDMILRTWENVMLRERRTG